jgi:hypothetical protein
VSLVRPEHAVQLAPERERAVNETSDEPFDRAAFARYALEVVRPARTTVAICEGAARMRVESGRTWGGARGERWVMLAIPARASRRAIALAVAELARVPPPYALDVLLA